MSGPFSDSDCDLNRVPLPNTLLPDALREKLGLRPAGDDPTYSKLKSDEVLDFFLNTLHLQDKERHKGSKLFLICGV